MGSPAFCAFGCEKADDRSVNIRRNDRPEMRGNVGPYNDVRLFPTSGRSRENHEVIGTPCRQSRACPGRRVELLEERAAGPHFAARGEGEQTSRSAAVVGRIKQHNPAHFQAWGLADGFAHHEAAHTVADKVDRSVQPSEVRGKGGPKAFDRGAARIVVAPNPARPDLRGDASPEPLPARMRPPDAVEDQRLSALFA